MWDGTFGHQKQMFKLTDKEMFHFYTWNVSLSGPKP